MFAEVVLSKIDGATKIILARASDFIWICISIFVLFDGSGSGIYCVLEEFWAWILVY